MKNKSCKIEFDVELAPEEVISRLSSIMDKEPFGCFTYTGDKKFIGKIKGQKFRIQKRINFNRSCNHILFGRVQQTQNGSRIQGCLRMYFFVRIIMIIYLAGTSAFSLFGVLILLTAQRPWPKNILVFTVQPIVMLVFGIVFIYIVNRIGKRYGNEVVSTILDLFSDVSF
jgi:hypothetical protein